MDPFFHTGLSISDSLKTVRKSVLIYETIIYHRLNSPGIIISNFAEPDNSKESIEEYYDLITLYLFFKTFPLLESSCLETRDRCDEYLINMIMLYKTLRFIMENLYQLF